MSDLEAIRAYVAAVDRVNGTPARSEAALTELAITLAPMWALGESLGPWPLDTPAGPLDSLDSPDALDSTDSAP